MVEFLIDQALREAIDLHNRNQLDDAKSLYNKIIEHDKKNSDAYHLLSLINLVEGKPKARIWRNQISIKSIQKELDINYLLKLTSILQEMGY